MNAKLIVIALYVATLALFACSADKKSTTTPGSSYCTYGEMIWDEESQKCRVDKRTFRTCEGAFYSPDGEHCVGSIVLCGEGTKETMGEEGTFVCVPTFTCGDGTQLVRNECHVRDSDGDGVGDVMDRCNGYNDTLDENGNGVPDDCEDNDRDSVRDVADNCPSLYNDEQEDANSDGVGDMCQDTDNDGWLDYRDTCPSIANPRQEDADGDDTGDVCESYEVGTGRTLFVVMVYDIHGPDGDFDPAIFTNAGFVRDGEIITLRSLEASGMRLFDWEEERDGERCFEDIGCLSTPGIRFFKIEMEEGAHTLAFYSRYITYVSIAVIVFTQEDLNRTDLSPRSIGSWHTDNWDRVVVEREEVLLCERTGTSCRSELVYVP